LWISCFIIAALWTWVLTRALCAAAAAETAARLEAASSSFFASVDCDVKARVGTRAWRRVATGGIAERLACFSGTLMT